MQLRSYHLIKDSSRETPSRRLIKAGASARLSSCVPRSPFSPRSSRQSGFNEACASSVIRPIIDHYINNRCRIYREVYEASGPRATGGPPSRSGNTRLILWVSGPCFEYGDLSKFLLINRIFKLQQRSNNYVSL